MPQGVRQEEDTPTRDSVIAVDGLVKTFALGFRRKRVEAVRGVSFEVRRGEIFGLVGPNGAGKTTTIKSMMGLISPTAGRMSILGEPVPTVRSRSRVGYLAEISYYYDYLKPEEILDFYGRLYGLDRGTRRERIDRLLERVGLGGARGKPLRKFSKGMLQRVGLAQALIADPEIVVLDEPQSGLDPIGRKEVADIIFELREQGKTVFFSSHILPDVERVCDRVAVMVKGRIVDIGPLDVLLNPRTLQTEIATGLGSTEVVANLQERFSAWEVKPHHGGYTFVIRGDEDTQEAVRAIMEAGLSIESVVPRRENLEDVFVREAVSAAESGVQPAKEEGA